MLSFFYLCCCYCCFNFFFLFHAVLRLTEFSVFHRLWGSRMQTALEHLSLRAVTLRSHVRFSVQKKKKIKGTKERNKKILEKKKKKRKRKRKRKEEIKSCEEKYLNIPPSRYGVRKKNKKKRNKKKKNLKKKKRKVNQGSHRQTSVTPYTAKLCYENLM